MKIALVLVALLALSPAMAGLAFAATPPPAMSEVGKEMLTVVLNQRARFRGAEVTPTRIQEESRCPIGVQCVRAGTVRVGVRIVDGQNRREAVLTLGQPLRLASGNWVTLAAVCPHPRHPGAARQESNRFTFLLGPAAPTPRAHLSCERLPQRRQRG